MAFILRSQEISKELKNFTSCSECGSMVLGTVKIHQVIHLRLVHVTCHIYLNFTK